MSRRMAREVAFKTLFQVDVGKNNVEPALSELIAENGLSADAAAFARSLVTGTVACLREIDDVLSRYLVKWTMPRLAAVDRSVLRLAAYEILYRDDIPAPVAINEALEISKLYNSEESARFLNGVLDRLAREKRQEGGEADVLRD